MMIKPTYVKGALIEVVGEAPGGEEVKQNEFFVGPSGQVMQKAFEYAGLDWSKVSKNNVAKRRPPDDGFKEEFYQKVPKLTKTGKPAKNQTVTVETPELVHYRELLKQELTDHKPNLVIACGGEALKALTGQEKITKLRGSVIPSTLVPGLKVLPILHPAWVLRSGRAKGSTNWKWYWITANDLKYKAKTEMEFPEYKVRGYTSYIAQDAPHAIHFLNSVHGRWCIDIETRAGGLACFSIAYCSWYDPYIAAMCIPIQTTTGPYFTPSEEFQVFQALQRLMDRNAHLVGQNIGFDIEHLLDYGVEPSGIYMDTMLAQSLVAPEFPKGLDFLASIYTDMPYYKDEGKTAGSKTPDKQLWDYNNKDTVSTLQISFKLDEELRENGLEEYYHEYVNREIGIALEMQRMKLAVDVPKRDLLKKLLGKLHKSTHNDLVKAAKVEVNVNSPQQVAVLLYDTLKLKLRGRVPANRSTKEDVLKELKAFNQEPILDLVMEERHIRKKISSYINIRMDPGGLLGFTANVAGTETGRWSFSKSQRNTGFNAQTMPKVLRYMIQPPPGRIFIQPDLSQAEARIVAWLSDCKSLIELFDDPTRSIHMENARAVFKREVEKDSPEYVLAKAMIHAANYMMGAKKFAVETGLHISKATELLETYHEQRPEIRQWHKSIRQEILDRGKLITPFGRERTFYEILGSLALTGKFPEDGLRDAVSYIPQATVPDITNHGMLATAERLDDIRFHQQGHDSYLASVPEDRLSECVEQVRRDLTRFVNIRGVDRIIPVEVSVGYNWYFMKDYEGERWLPKGVWEKWMESKKVSDAKFEAKLNKLLVGIV
jgi:DNA polymerase I-like protein with 3'-5' exonuclease and polymerase domains/uracil-DNA glycosylase